MSLPETSSTLSYIIISPVKDEERYVELTLRSVISQTLKPVLWLIVDDGSQDHTPEIVSRYLGAYSFIRIVRNLRAGERKLAFGEVLAFNWGCELIGNTDFEFIVKLDCDLSFDSEYFEHLFKRFRQDERLGIASGIYLERNNVGVWKEILMPPYHAAGASKVMRRACFEDIGGFIPAPGWDTVDEIKAMTKGWKTVHFRDLIMKHHKREGSSIGAVKTGILQGNAYYRSGGSKLFFVIKVLHRMFTWPYIASALGLCGGYLLALFKKEKLLVTEVEACYYKTLLLARLKAPIISLFKKR